MECCPLKTRDLLEPAGWTLVKVGLWKGLHEGESRDIKDGKEGEHKEIQSNLARN